jgi:hypothetical protein
VDIGMRLLRSRPDGNFELVTFSDDNLPPYAILSHTWIDSEEVTYDELLAGSGKDKAGYAKILFCGERVAKDGLQYFWMDTCCINRRSEVELSEAINSMFSWYQQASRCYVYLSDVSTKRNSDSKGNNSTEGLPKSLWGPAIRQSRWFTRGWTLQELIVPSTVEFYSSDGEKLGDKSSLETIINEVTGVAREALRGDDLANFSIDERMAWAANRSTTREEDMTLIRLRDEIGKAYEREFQQDSSATKSTILTSTFESATKTSLTDTTSFSASPPGLLAHFAKTQSSAQRAKQETDIGTESEHGVDNYSDAGSVANYEEFYANILSNELLQDLDIANRETIEPVLQSALEEFAIRIGYQGESQDHRNMMYVVYKYRR